MEIKFVVLLVVLLQLEVNSNRFKCALPSQFGRKYSKLGGQSYKEAKKTSKVKLHQFFYSRGNPLKYRSPTEVKEIKDLDPKTTIRRIPQEEQRLINILRAVEFTMTLCDQKTEDYSTMFECESPTVVSLYGCVEGESTVSFLEEYMEQDLTSQNAVEQYIKLDPFKKVEAMLDIIDRFIELHRAGIVHGDIKLENILTKGLEFSNFKIFNLLSANHSGEPISGGTEGLFPPEIVLSASYDRVVSFQQDIYALGMTFAYLHSDGFADTIGETLKIDSKNTNFLKIWDEKVAKGLEEVFHKDDKLKSIREVIQEAVNANTNQRFKSMEEFSNKLYLKFKDLKGADKVIKEIKNSGKTFDINSETPSPWRNNIVPKPKTPEPNVNTTPIKSVKPLIWINKSLETTLIISQNRLLI